MINTDIFDYQKFNTYIVPPKKEIEGSFLERIHDLKSTMPPQTETKQKVVILGAGPAGLIRAITSIMNGNPTQIIEKRSEKESGRQNTIHLNLGTVYQLVHLGAYQYLLENKLIYPQKNLDSINVRLVDLEEALKAVLKGIQPAQQITYHSKLEAIDSSQKKLNLTIESADHQKTIIENVGICPSWEPGVRVRVAKHDIFCDWTLSGSYTWIHSTDSQSIHAVGTVGSLSDYVSSPLFGPVIANVDDQDQLFFTNGAASWKTNYQTWDALLSYDFECNRCSTFTPFFGVEGLILSQQLRAAFALLEDDDEDRTQEAAVSWKSSYFGVGLKLGTDYVFNLFDCLKLFARASGSIVVGDNCSSSHQVYHRGTGTGTAAQTRFGRYKDDDCCLIVPGYHIQLGVQYDNNWCGTDVALRLGWEFVQWFNIANPRSYGNTYGGGSTFAANNNFAVQASSGDTSTIGYNGLIAGLDVRF